MSAPHLAHLSVAERQAIADACRHDHEHPILRTIDQQRTLRDGSEIRYHWVSSYCPRCGLLISVELARADDAPIFAEARA